MKLPNMRGGGGIFRPKIEGEKSLWQLICGNGIAEMGGKKIVAVDLWQCCCQNGREKKCGNGERESCLDKKIILDSYSKKYSYSYSFRVSVVFLTEAVWFVCMSCSFISSCKSILCMISL